MGLSGLRCSSQSGYTFPLGVPASIDIDEPLADTMLLRGREIYRVSQSVPQDLGAISIEACKGVLEYNRAEGII